MKIKSVIYQEKLLGEIPLKDLEYIKSQGPDHVALPEYFFHPEIVTYEKSIKLMEEYSTYLNCVLIAGTTVLQKNGKLYNTCYIYDRGQQKGDYQKINLFYREHGRITPGKEFRVFNINNVKIGLMICADALSKKAWQDMTNLKPDIIYIPTFSPYKKETKQEKFLRDNEIYVNGASMCNCTVVKVCCIGKFHEAQLQGRSLVATPEKILWRVMPDQEDKKIIKTIELEV
jgi:predicted amidohydrolase